jgi:hypothetical protein
MRAISRLLLGGLACGLLAAGCGSEEEPNSCEHPEDLRNVPCADLECNLPPFCPLGGFALAGMWSMTGQRFVEVGARECSSCLSDLQVRLTLTPPPDADYDLHVWRDCSGPPEQSSENVGLGAIERLVVEFVDNPILPEQSHHFVVEVRPRGTVPASSWTLTLEGSDC